MNIEKELNNKAMNELFEAILKLENQAECKKFFRDLCTFGELNAMRERLQVAKKIKAKVSYREIAKKTGVSTATITRVAHWLHHGMGGYKLVLDRIN